MPSSVLRSSRALPRRSGRRLGRSSGSGPAGRRELATLFRFPEPSLGRVLMPMLRRARRGTTPRAAPAIQLRARASGWSTDRLPSDRLRSKRNGVYGDTGEVYRADALRGIGSVAGRSARCIAAPTAIQFHTGYEHDANDEHDVRLLCARRSTRPAVRTLALVARRTAHPKLTERKPFRRRSRGS